MIDKSYVDSQGCIKLTKAGDIDNGNPHVYNAYVAMCMMLKHGAIMGIEPLRHIKTCRVRQGLFRRRPGSTDVVSHDEYNGIAAFACFRDYLLAREIIAYGKRNSWQFNDLEPEQGVSVLKVLKSPVRFIKFIMAVKRDGADEVEEAGAFKDFISLKYWRQPRDRFFYAVAARKNFSFFSLVWFCASVIITARKEPSAYANGSSQLMACLKLVAISKTGFKSFFVYWAFKYFLGRMCKRFNVDAGSSCGVLGSLVEMHFKDREHPLHDLARHVNLEGFVNRLKPGRSSKR